MNQHRNRKRTDRISEHFCMDEFIYSRVAVENGLDNTPPSDAVKGIRNLVDKLLEPLRAYHGKPIPICSGYRSEELNRRVRGARDSQHRKGEAVDIYTLGSNLLLEDLKESKLNFDQVIFYRLKGFMHLSLKLNGENRRQIII
ncbi:D-Ala-D-Ala carboxypeptidase family metallohydrolase, partial [Parabacteroides provencensis]|uniref:D-Ala-D-Ala carboxypeptidase family metallohydrolase n=1 Tax=Parabacteroides provencensis TaxID=1944636 RepID=UPI000C15D4AD